MSTNPTRTGSTIFGKSVPRDLLALAIAGSVFIGGYTFVDRAQTSLVQNFFGTGSYLSYDDVICTNTGGLAKYTACSFQNPSSTQTGVLLHVQVNTEEAPASSSITCSTSADGTATGTVLFKYIATASGHAVGTNVLVAGTGTGGRLTVLPPNHYIRCWYSTNPRPGYTKNLPLKQQLRVYFNGYYQP